jgi:hypothetical protein
MKLRTGLVVVISDFFDPAGVDAIFAALGGLNHRLLLTQLIKPADSNPELNPDFSGEIRLQDCETQAETEVRISPSLLARYKDIYQTFNQTLFSRANNNNAGLIQLNTEQEVLPQLTELFEGGKLSL